MDLLQIFGYAHSKW